MTEQLKTPQPENYPANAPKRIYPGDPGFHKTEMTKEKSAPPGNMVIGADWRVMLNENFTTSNADMMRWWTRYTFNNGYQDYLNDEWERYREDGNHVCDGSTCALTAQPHNGEFWPSGMLRSKDQYDIGNGDPWYLECRAKIPRGLGVWPAFWIGGVERTPGDESTNYWPPEIDIMEIVNNGDWGDNTTCLHCGGKGWDDWQENTWTWWDNDFLTDFAFWQAPYDFADGYHTFGLYYCRPEFVIYVDRRPILAGTYQWNDWMGPVPGCNILCNLAIGGSWAGRNGVDNDAMPQSMDVDYIRVYTRVRQSTIGHDLLPK